MAERDTYDRAFLQVTNPDEPDAAYRAGRARLSARARAFQLGDVNFHTGWTFHRAGADTSGAPRAVMTAIYLDADITLIEPITSQHLAEIESWMPGTRPGDVPV